MKNKNGQAFSRELSWSTKIYVLVAISIAIGSFVFDAWSTNWSLTMLVVIAIVFLVEHFWVVAHRHPKSWRIFKWTVLLLGMAWLFLGAG